MEETGDVHVRLRRFVFEKDDGRPPCPGPRGYHNAHSEVVARMVEKVDARGIVREVPASDFEGNPSWPTTCMAEECSYEFVQDDQWQAWTDRIYRRPDTGEEFDAKALPVGSLFDARWFPDAWKGADGIAMVCVLPPQAEDTRGHWWNADGPSSSGGGWNRQGDPRHPETVTVSPSILTNEYHGFLQAGFLTDSLGDRPLPPGPDQP